MTSSLRLPATRWGAFLSHLLISLGILIALALFIAFVMFPGALFTLAGGVEGLKIITGVDMVLGPLLTLIIYNRSKPLRELMRDLSIIAAIQIAALTAGMYLVHSSRPAAVAYAYDQFHTTKTGEFDSADVARPAGLRWFQPVFYNIRLPADDDEALTKMAEFEFSGVSVRLRTDLYEPLAPAEKNEMLARQLRMSDDEKETDGQPCIVRSLSTAFDLADVCFDPKSRKFSLLDDASSEET